MFSILSSAQNVAEKALPVFKDGKAQIVDAFNGDHNWVNHDLWTETEFDTDRDGEPNRMHVSVTRQTNRYHRQNCPLYISSPYFAGVAEDVPESMWNAERKLGGKAEERTLPEVTHRSIPKLIIS